MIGAIEIGFDVFALVDPDFDANAAFATALNFIAEAGAAIAFTEQFDRQGLATSQPPNE